MKKCSIYLKATKGSSRNNPETSYERIAGFNEDRCERNF